MNNRVFAERLWRVAGAPLPELAVGETVILAAGGWITGLSSEGAGRVLLTNRRLLHIRQVVWPHFPRRDKPAYTSEIALERISAMQPLAGKASRINLELVGIRGERWRIVSARARSFAAELERLGVPTRDVVGGAQT